MSLRPIATSKAAPLIWLRLRKINRTPLARLTIVYRIQRHQRAIRPDGCPPTPAPPWCDPPKPLRPIHPPGCASNVSLGRLWYGLSLLEGGNCGDVLLVSSPRATVEVGVTGCTLNLIA